MTKEKTPNNDKMIHQIAKCFIIDESDISFVEQDVNETYDSSEIDYNTKITFFTSEGKLKDKEVGHLEKPYKKKIKENAELIYPQELDIHISISDDIEIIIKKIDDGKAKEVF